MQFDEESAISFEFVQDLLGTLDSEWSGLVVSGLLSRMMSGTVGKLQVTGHRSQVAGTTLTLTWYV